MHPGNVAVLFILFLVTSSAASGCLGHQETSSATGRAISSGNPAASGSAPVSDGGRVLNSGNGNATDIPTGRGSYVFWDLRGNGDRRITIYTYRPSSWNVSGPVLFIMPGAGRSGQPSRDAWIPYGDRYSCLLVVPEFSLADYPDDGWYPLGNMIGPSGTTWNPKANWTYMAIEHIFDDVRVKTGARRCTYLLFGHSAGAQFVHRLVTFLPEARFSRAVAANAGVYVMPVYSIDYPFGLKNSTMPEYGLGNVFSKKLIIMSGSNDTDPKDPSLANFPLAEAEGKNRFERAKSYYTAAQKEAGSLGVPLNWEYHVVPGVGHDEAGMAGPSAEILFNDT